MPAAFVGPVAARPRRTGIAAGLRRERPAIPIDANDIAGTVTGPAGPEAAYGSLRKRSDFATTTFMRSVVTDDVGRFVIPTCLRRGIAYGSVATGSPIPKDGPRGPASE